jgi:hypothetical protein
MLCGVAMQINREVLEPMQRVKIDAGSDTAFYDSPRLCTHVDEVFLGQLTQLYRERLPAGGQVLDLMSSWVSHLPAEVSYSKVVGHGMNAQELIRNPRLSEFFVRVRDFPAARTGALLSPRLPHEPHDASSELTSVTDRQPTPRTPAIDLASEFDLRGATLQNLNEAPELKAEDGTYDAVVCCVSVQYMQVSLPALHRRLQMGFSSRVVVNPQAARGGLAHPAGTSKSNLADALGLLSQP